MLLIYWVRQKSLKNLSTSFFLLRLQPLKSLQNCSVKMNVNFLELKEMKKTFFSSCALNIFVIVNSEADETEKRVRFALILIRLIIIIIDPSLKGKREKKVFFHWPIFPSSLFSFRWGLKVDMNSMLIPCTYNHTAWWWCFITKL